MQCDRGVALRGLAASLCATAIHTLPFPIVLHTLRWTNADAAAATATADDDDGRGDVDVDDDDAGGNGGDDDVDGGRNCLADSCTLVALRHQAMSPRWVYPYTARE